MVQAVSTMEYSPLEPVTTFDKVPSVRMTAPAMGAPLVESETIPVIIPVPAMVTSSTLGLRRWGDRLCVVSPNLSNHKVPCRFTVNLLIADAVPIVIEHWDLCEVCISDRILRSEEGLSQAVIVKDLGPELLGEGKVP